jgi:hypothetical protein
MKSKHVILFLCGVTEEELVISAFIPPALLVV